MASNQFNSLGDEISIELERERGGGEKMVSITKINIPLKVHLSSRERER